MARSEVAGPGCDGFGVVSGWGLVLVPVFPGGVAGTSAGVWPCSPASAACSGAWRAFSVAGVVVSAVVFGVDSGLAAVPGGWMVNNLGAGIGLSISGRGGGRCGALVVGSGGAVWGLAAGRAVAAGRVSAVGWVTRLGLRDLLCRTAVVDPPLVALWNTTVRSSHPRV